MKLFTIYRLPFTILMVACLCLTACNSDVVYSHFVPVSSEKWHADSIAEFDYHIADTTVNYRMLIYVRHTERYPYQNMWLFVEDETMTDTIEFYLADDRGNWLGDSHNGFIEMPVLFDSNKHFADTGMYHIAIQHGMRDSLLRGVTDIGLELERVESQQ